jgi:hypothetical protein
MAQAKKKAKKAAGSATPYVKRIAQDEDLRENILQAYESARKAYNRLNNGKSPSKQIFDDKKLQKELKSAAESIKDAGYALREPKKKKGGGVGKLLLVSIVGAGLALAVSESLRKKVLDALFGAEEEFEYSSTTTASTPSPSEAAGTTN